MANAQAHLLILPNEKFAEVAELLDATDLMSLRQVSKQVAAAVDAPFLKRYFSRRTQVYTHHGLQALLDIVSVPRLSAYVQEIRIIVLQPSRSSTEPMSQSNFAWNRYLHSKTLESDDKALILTFEERERIRHKDERIGEKDKRDWKRHCEQTTRLSMAWKVESAAVSSNEQGMSLLAATFEALSIEGKAAKITIKDLGPRRSDDTGIYGVYQLHESLGGIDALKRHDLVAGSCGAATATLLSALARSKLLVEELDLCSCNRHYGLGLDAFNVSQYS